MCVLRSVSERDRGRKCVCVCESWDQSLCERDGGKVCFCVCQVNVCVREMEGEGVFLCVSGQCLCKRDGGRKCVSVCALRSKSV